MSRIPESAEARAERRTQRLQRIKGSHGEYKTYLYGGCRCRPCKDANAERSRNYRKGERKRKPQMTWTEVIGG